MYRHFHDIHLYMYIILYTSQFAQYRPRCILSIWHVYMCVNHYVAMYIYIKMPILRFYVLS